jgi:hypothetical protein
MLMMKGQNGATILEQKNYPESHGSSVIKKLLIGLQSLKKIRQETNG